MVDNESPDFPRAENRSRGSGERVGVPCTGRQALVEKFEKVNAWEAFAGVDPTIDRKQLFSWNSHYRFVGAALTAGRPKG
ncbi:hypothetical protein CEXT_605591 [Caerostris extrusa]|uniref:Uncharacterized protein n=1 Tax=Caerostris extrusa TaxID=172846 RepID=A0AAV4Y3G3_CAEEX|nr:hypothetical protein CEXT_605591 [Caerostris extrusa]